MHLEARADVPGGGRWNAAVRLTSWRQRPHPDEPEKDRSFHPASSPREVRRRTSRARPSVRCRRNPFLRASSPLPFVSIVAAHHPPLLAIFPRTVPHVVRGCSRPCDLSFRPRRFTNDPLDRPSRDRTRSTLSCQRVPPGRVPQRKVPHRRFRKRRPKPIDGPGGSAMEGKRMGAVQPKGGKVTMRYRDDVVRCRIAQGPGNA